LLNACLSSSSNNPHRPLSWILDQLVSYAIEVVDLLPAVAAAAAAAGAGVIELTSRGAERVHIGVILGAL
jgi:hypothetical protein